MLNINILRGLGMSLNFHRSNTSLRAFSTTSRRLADPWILPNTPEHLSSTQTPPPDSNLPDVQPVVRRNESLETLISRLTYQSRKRGTLEADLLLSTFARDQLPVMAEDELKEYDKLLDEPDWDIYYWSTGKRQPPERWVHSKVLEKLKVHAANKGKVVRRMPNLDNRIERTPK